MLLAFLFDFLIGVKLFYQKDTKIVDNEFSLC